MAGKQKRCYQFPTDGGPVEAGGTFFCVQSRGCGRYISGLPVSGFKGLLPCQCKTQCVLRIWQKLYARFRDGLGEAAGERGVRIVGAIRGRRKWCQISGDRQGGFPCTGAGMGNPDAERSGLGGGGVMTGKEKGVDREISKNQIRKQV